MALLLGNLPPLSSPTVQRVRLGRPDAARSVTPRAPLLADDGAPWPTIQTASTAAVQACVALRVSLPPYRPLCGLDRAPAAGPIGSRQPAALHQGHTNGDRNARQANQPGH